MVKTWTSKYNLFGFSPVSGHFICVSPLLNVHNLFFHTDVRIGWNQEISIIRIFKNKKDRIITMLKFVHTISR